MFYMSIFGKWSDFQQSGSFHALLQNVTWLLWNFNTDKITKMVVSIIYFTDVIKRLQYIVKFDRMFEFGSGSPQVDFN